jgi:anti-sigma regulatory factor (Ser/Thr protein kinase)
MLAHLQAMDVDRECCEDVILALDEACANVIRHAFPGGLSASYSLSAVLTPDAVEMVVEDRGRGIDPATLERARDGADPEATSGRGLYLMRQLMSSVEIEQANGTGTRVRMRKRLRAPSGGGATVAGARPEQGLAGSRPPAGLFRDPMF